MRISGKTIIGIAAGIAFTGVAVLTAINYREIRDEEEAAKKDAERKNAERQPDEPEVVAEAPKSTGEAIVEAVKRTGNDIVDSIKDDPLATCLFAGVGILAGVCYSAGVNDGVDAGQTTGVRKGYAYGFAAGMLHDADICATANPETYDQIYENMQMYVKLHPDAKTIDAESFMHREGYIDNVKEIYNSARLKA